MRTGRARSRLLMAAIIAMLGSIIAAPAHAAERSFTAADVAKHGTSSSCWTIVGGGVYDITPFIAKHPGGRSAVTTLCGKDGSAAFNGQHGGASNPRKALAHYRIGKLKKSATGTSTRTSGTQGGAVTIEQVARHATPSDCWSMINGSAYNLTSFISKHPGGSSRIIAICGRDGSAAFAGQHAGSSTVLRTLAAYEVSSSGKAQSPSSSTGSNRSSSRGDAVDHRGQAERDEDGTDEDGTDEDGTDDGRAGRDHGRDHDDD